MREKITLEEFRNIKESLIKLYDDYDILEFNGEEDEKKEFKKLEEEQKKLMDKLLSYDLSDIPFEEWDEFYIYSEENYVFDFSKTHANIDFSLMELYCKYNLKGCNIKNLNKLYDIDPESFDEETIKKNPKIFLLGDNVDPELRNRYFNRALTKNDVLDNLDLFADVSLWNFLEDSERNKGFYFLIVNLGIEDLKKAFKINPDIIRYIAETDSYNMSGIFYDKDHVEEINYNGASFETYFNEKISNFWKHYHFETKEELLYYKPELFSLDKDTQAFIDLIGLDNIKRFEKEYEVLFQKSNDIPSLNLFDKITKNFSVMSENFNLKKPESYEEVSNYIAKYINKLRTTGNFHGTHKGYDYIQGKFRDEHPEIFLREDAPEALKTRFYVESLINLNYITDHPEIIPFLLDTDLSTTINANIDLEILFPMIIDNKTVSAVRKANFIKEYTERYGNAKMLELCKKYGHLLDYITIENDNDEIDDEKLIEKNIMKAIYKKILNNNADYRILANVPEFINEYPNLFVDLSSLSNIPLEEREKITQNLYYLNPNKRAYVKKYPELIQILKDKDLITLFNINTYNSKNEKEVFENIGNEKYLELCSIYGDYLDFEWVQYNFNDLNYIEEKIKERITYHCMDSGDAYDEDAPDFIKQSHPEIFLGEDAPVELKTYFYRKIYGFDFDFLSRHKEWLPYLKGKDIRNAMIKDRGYSTYINQFFELFGEEKAIKLGINRSETVMHMMQKAEVKLMKDWYDKTGGKFIPDCVIMDNIPIEDADKFLTSGANWSKLMKIKDFANNMDSREAMFKLAYSFGVFDNDTLGMKKVYDLLAGIPKKIDGDFEHIFDNLYEEMDRLTGRKLLFKNAEDKQKDIDKIINFIKSPISVVSNVEYFEKQFEALSIPKEEGHAYYSAIFDSLVEPAVAEHPIEKDSIAWDPTEFIKTLLKENIEIDFSKNVFDQLYRKNDDGSYTLMINQQSCPKTVQNIRNELNDIGDLPIITPGKAHHYLGGFKVEYDPQFREFFLENLDTILKNDMYLANISVVQRRFNEIKIVYSNMKITPELAFSYVEHNKYENVNVGNELVTKAASIQSYSQADFEKIQEIFNYGKQRTFSSIPKIKSEAIEKAGELFYYEILDLTDPRAMSIGFESTCCQRLKEPAEVCMEHSMVDKNGRVMVITNPIGEVIAQSWIWRNKDVLCFDNIEVPDPKMWDHGIPKGREDDGIRNEFTDNMLDIYRMAAKEIMEIDSKMYKELLDAGKITQEQYDGLRLGKITIGEGYSNIKGSFVTLPKDKGTLTRPLHFDQPVKLREHFYTSDSLIQYILNEREDRKKYNGETLPVYNDSYTEYDDEKFSADYDRHIRDLNKLEMVTKNNPYYLETSVRENVDSKHVVTEIADNYGLDEEKTKIILQPNFAIIYEVKGDKLKIADLLYNTKIDNKDQQMDIEAVVTMQLRLAIDQIGKDKEIDISRLEDYQKEFYEKAMNLKDELDIERGVGHAK